MRQMIFYLRLCHSRVISVIREALVAVKSVSMPGQCHLGRVLPKKPYGLGMSPEKCWCSPTVWNLTGCTRAFFAMWPMAAQHWVAHLVCGVVLGGNLKVILHL